MKYNVEWLKDAGIVEVVAEGAVNHEKRKEIFRASRIAVEKHDCNKLLINKSKAARFLISRWPALLELVNMIQGCSCPKKLKSPLLRRKQRTMMNSLR
ncbi:MAG: hypothetical protein R2861_09660 [Desulfobacterales bacterium]